MRPMAQVMGSLFRQELEPLLPVVVLVVNIKHTVDEVVPGGQNSIGANTSTATDTYSY